MLSNQRSPSRNSSDSNERESALGRAGRRANDAHSLGLPRDASGFAARSARQNRHVDEQDSAQERQVEGQSVEYAQLRGRSWVRVRLPASRVRGHTMHVARYDHGKLQKTAQIRGESCTVTE